MADYGGRVEEEQAAAKALKMSKARGARKGMKSKGQPKPPPQDVSDRADDESTPIPTAGATIAGSSLGAQDRVDGSNPHVHFIIDPALLEAGRPDSGDRPDGEHQINPETILINGPEMQHLYGVGYPPTLPVNGPNEGLPMYAVPASASGILNRLTTVPEAQTLDETTTNTQQPMQRRVSPRKKNRTSDARTVEEGQKLLRSHTKGSRRTRRG